MKGYKVFNPDFTCKGFQFTENNEFKISGEIEICNRGFHFCTKASHCFSYYSFNPENIVCEVEALGKVLTHDEDSKICTNHIRIGRRLTWAEVLEVANEGKGNSGFGNSGDRNSGDRNSGDMNSGDMNSGDRNSGYRNSGDRNSGDRNSGYRNSGDMNSGDRNSGDMNSGDMNSGDMNSGDRNSGDRNSGDMNSGDRNSGDMNSGDMNSGYISIGNHNSGVFCTGTKYLSFFDKPSKITLEKFKESKVFNLIYSIDTKLWVGESQMTDEEKQKHPSYKANDGYLKDIPIKEAFQNAWNNWSDENRKEFTKLPNFNKKIFFEITGVKI